MNHFIWQSFSWMYSLAWSNLEDLLNMGCFFLAEFWLDVLFCLK